MQESKRKAQLDFSEIYIEPVSSCNLDCKLCYANTLNGADSTVLPASKILDFLRVYASFYGKAPYIYWCGTGEIFLHPDFPEIINTLNQEFDYISHNVVTNGTIDRLQDFQRLDNMKLFVSIDGPEAHHEWNRGVGTYKTSLDFCKKALSLGCGSLGISTLVTKYNILSLLDFEEELRAQLKSDLDFCPIILYTTEQLKNIPSSAIKHAIASNDAIFSEQETISRLLSQYGNRYQESCDSDAPISLSLSLSYLGIFSCCEGIYRLGDIDTPLKELDTNLKKAAKKCPTCPLNCNGCG
jgi:MoaA/NifB/PqqE/SkfB family radical SAM enzyme